MLPCGTEVMVRHGTWDRKFARHVWTVKRGTLRWCQVAPGGSAARHRPHRIETHDHRRPRVERQLVADLAAAQQLAEQAALAGRQADEHATAVDLDDRDLVLRAVDPEPASQLMHRDVGAALDEAPELWRRAAGGALRLDGRNRRPDGHDLASERFLIRADGVLVRERCSRRVALDGTDGLIPQAAALLVSDLVSDRLRHLLRRLRRLVRLVP